VRCPACSHQVQGVRSYGGRLPISSAIVLRTARRTSLKDASCITGHRGHWGGGLLAQPSDKLAGGRGLCTGCGGRVGGGLGRAFGGQRDQGISTGFSHQRSVCGGEGTQQQRCALRTWQFQLGRHRAIMASVDCLESGSLGRARKGSEETVLDSWSHRVLRQVDLLSVCGDGHSVPTQPPNRTTNPSRLRSERQLGAGPLGSVPAPASLMLTSPIPLT